MEKQVKAGLPDLQESEFAYQLSDKIRAKYDGLLDRVSFYLPFVPGHNEAGWRATIAGFER